MPAGDARDRRARDRWEHTKVWHLKPEVVRQLVDGSGFRRGALAKKMGVPQATFEHWMETGRMTYASIGRLAGLLRRPQLMFFHKEPLPDRILTDYRGAAVSCTAIGTAPALSPNDIVAVRVAGGLQEQAGYMLAELVKEARRTGAARSPREHARRLLAGIGQVGGEPDAEDGPETWPDNPHDRSIRARRVAWVDYSPHKAAREALHSMGLPLCRLVEYDGPPGFDALRYAVEAHGNTLVFQEDMDMDTVRSVVLAGGEGRERDVPPATPHVIILNAGDAEGVQSFSMLHGYGHILLGRGGEWGGDGGGGGWGCICREGGGGVDRRRSRRPVQGCEGDGVWGEEAGGGDKQRPRRRTGMEMAEMWCDSFAASMLMPYLPFVDSRMDLEKAVEMPWRTGAAARQVASRLADEYQTSMYAAAVRAIDTARVGESSRYVDWYERLAGEVANTAGTSYGEPAERRIKKGRGNVAAYCESGRGRRFIRTVLAAHEMEHETTHDAIVMLGILVNDIDDVANLADEWPDAGAGGEYARARPERGGG